MSVARRAAGRTVAAHGELRGANDGDSGQRCTFSALHAGGGDGHGFGAEPAGGQLQGSDQGGESPLRAADSEQVFGDVHRVVTVKQGSLVVFSWSVAAMHS